ncbi:hypothetical protein HDV03_001894 [Kappamyces sp. JEL0829]|nr:hypothetical protein HDV03_001894 [Kappamyces sp. JEL0829]
MPAAPMRGVGSQAKVNKQFGIPNLNAGSSAAAAHSQAQVQYNAMTHSLQQAGLQAYDEDDESFDEPDDMDFEDYEDDE